MNRHLFLSLIASAALAGALAVACAKKQAPPPPPPAPTPYLTAVTPPPPPPPTPTPHRHGLFGEIQGRSGSAIQGEITVEKAHHGHGVDIEIKVWNAPPGNHGVHIHERGDCGAGDASSAGAHLNPGKHPHGNPKRKHHHAGDLPNLHVDEDGHGTLKTSTHHLDLTGGKHGIVGRALVIHARQDDYTTQPGGNAGPRIGCAVIEKYD